MILRTLFRLPATFPRPAWQLERSKEEIVQFDAMESTFIDAFTLPSYKQYSPSIRLMESDVG